MEKRKPEMYGYNLSVAESKLRVLWSSSITPNFCSRHKKRLAHHSIIGRFEMSQSVNTLETKPTERLMNVNAYGDTVCRVVIRLFVRDARLSTIGKNSAAVSSAVMKLAPMELLVLPSLLAFPQQ